ncbi:MAG: hypothetical protein EOO46_18265 [Flavobacterium sp.]|nr:MAG: hypothetical protein EOO46_18265 [Flavobacterium sp.]
MTTNSQNFVSQGGVLITEPLEDGIIRVASKLFVRKKIDQTELNLLMEKIRYFKTSQKYLESAAAKSPEKYLFAAIKLPKIGTTLISQANSSGPFAQSPSILRSHLKLVAIFLSLGALVGFAIYLVKMRFEI